MMRPHLLPLLMAALLLFPEPALCVGAGVNGNGDVNADVDVDTGEGEPRERVVLRLRRSVEVCGYVELEDAEVIVLRLRDGELESFAKSDVGTIVRLVEPEPGQRGTVLLRNGNRTSGEILEDSFERVIVEVEGVPITFRRETVDHVVLAPTFAEQYAEFRASIRDDTPGRHLSLCRWLFDQRRYEMAADELDTLLSLHPDLGEARRLQRIVEAQLALLADAPARPDGGEDQPAPDDGRRSGAVPMKDLLPERLLTRREVNLLRVYEIDFNRPPKVNVPPETIRTLLETYGSSDFLPATASERTALFRADPLRVVHTMFQLRCRELYDQIEVMTEPHALNLFRQRVHNTWLINNCATSRCHGGPYAGRLFLHRDNHRSDRVRYTNLLILDRLELDVAWPLINYGAPGDSLIIQHALPRELARKPHPPVDGWTPVFTRSNRRLLRSALEWIEAMMKPRPEYPIEYEPPVMGGPQTPTDAQAGPAADERAPR